MVNYSPVKLLEYVRSGLVEQEHFGMLVKISADGEVFKLGDDASYPFYLRSCAKPLQTSLIVDFGLDEFYKMTPEEIAICCASHAGEFCHTKTAQVLLEKIGLDESCLKCGLHKPISKTEQDKLILAGESETILQNNCSGKHVMMLAICKKMGWGVNDYDSLSHPLQVAIQKKIYELCEVKQDYSITKDGCGVPIYAMPLENMICGYLNLFLDEKYSKIRNAFLQKPYLIGGENRLDTAIMSVNKKLIAKVGAGGLCIVVNLEKKEGLIIKIMDCDMKARAICLIDALKQLNWLDESMLENDLIKAQNKKDILTLHGEKIGEIVPAFSFSSSFRAFPFEINGNLYDIPDVNNFEDCIVKVFNIFQECFGIAVMSKINFYIDNATFMSGCTPIITRILKKYLIIKLGIEKFDDTVQIVYQFSHELCHYVFYSYCGLEKKLADFREESICSAMSLCMIKNILPNSLDYYVNYTKNHPNEAYRGGSEIAQNIDYDINALKHIILETIKSK